MTASTLMSRLRNTLLLALLCGFALGSRAQSPDLPAGPLQQKARTACMECHDAGIIVQQRLDKKTWGKEVDKMIRWGALVEKQDRDAFVDYFASSFSPDKTAVVPQYSPRTAAENKASNRENKK